MVITQTHPGNIRELVYRIGWFLPPEEQWLPSNNRVRHPKSLISCMKVNRLWCEVLTPLLWMEFDAELAFQLEIPPSIIQVRSQDIRYAKLSSEFPTPILNASHLRALDVDFMEPMAIRDLTRSNIKLESLSVGLKHDFVLLSLKPILAPLKQLRVLHLHHCNVATLDQIVTPLSYLPELKSLELSSFSLLGPSETPLPQLYSVTDLVLGCRWARNPGQVQIVRCCPNLRSLQVQVEPRQTASFPSAALSTNLQECCPKLTSLQHRSRTLNIPAECNQYEINHHEDLLKINHLEDYCFPVAIFCTRFCDALLVHAPSLKTIKLDCGSASDSCWQDVGRLLSLCPNLVSVQLSFQHQPAESESCLALFEEPWVCSNLEELDLRGLYPRNVGKLVERVSNLLYERWNVKETHVRLASLENLSDGDEISSDESDSSSEGSNSSDESDDSDENEGPLDESEFPSQATNTQHRLRRSISYWTAKLANHPQPDRNFYHKIAKEHWKTSSSLGHMEGKMSRLEKIVWDRVFEQVLAWPKMRRLNLEGTQFVKRGRTMWSLAQGGSQMATQNRTSTIAKHETFPWRGWITTGELRAC
ncbi:hypothetical protein BGZ81_007388 [Podila clonocystis]|nr:hypothetical protein BGZ81_007388 [Podila clonocystis]